MARKIRTDEVSILIIPLEEMESPRSSQALVVDDEDDVERYGSAVDEMVEKYGLWGWCVVNVKVKFAGLEGNAYLGNCSYKDEDDFKRGGYYLHMVEEAMEELQDQVDEIIERVKTP